VVKHDTVDLKGRAVRIAGLWKRISKEQPYATFWAHARVMSSKIGCELRKLPENLYQIDNDIQRLGQTDGRVLYVRSFRDKVHEAFVFFHEVGHVLLHYGTEKRWRILTTKQMEIEADDFATVVCMVLWPEHKELYKQLSDDNAGKKDPLDKYFP
jgi:Zn-dependent peptidase ImmA (M78 family)